MQTKYFLFAFVSIIFLGVWLLVLSVVQDMVSARSTSQNVWGVILFLGTALLSGFFIIKVISKNSIK